MTTTATRRTVAPGHAAIEVLKANGVEVVFGLNGDHVLRLYDGLADLGGIKHVTVKHENNAALAAEAYGRLTGRPGVALATAGPGRLNSISGVACAMASGAPVRLALRRRPGERRARNVPRRRRGRLHRARVRERQPSPRVASPAPRTSRLHWAMPSPGGRRPTRPDPRRSDPRRPRGRRRSTPRHRHPRRRLSAEVAPDLDRARRAHPRRKQPVIVAGKGAWYPPSRPHWSRSPRPRGAGLPHVGRPRRDADRASALARPVPCDGDPPCRPVRAGRRPI